MGLGTILGKIFGNGDNKASAVATAEEAVEYKGVMITAAPINEGGQFRTAGTISKEIDGEQRSVQFVRADINSDRQSAVAHSERKAQQIVDEQGDAIFKRDNV
ncbi:HlyU family transcriptional regulator [Granulosicoccus antarcticus]|uniref:Transcriptional activator HlyU n=1 Tax=Granulosicoccus antarcticus IMCC3135 TaxID=1192854 RepID=A0A2Z2NUQ9_9GAMM|nr:HlyU family transcriptional regulator [Granulosicoccus antarcticus]ASJ75236.1 hypothetical protein IMCC3135_25905 [Granulosicoccus antarcticus IMCC3135]